MDHNKFYAPSRRAIEIVNGINQDYFLPNHVKNQREIKEVQRNRKSQMGKWVSIVSVQHSMAWKHTLVVQMFCSTLCQMKMTALKNEQVDLGFRVEKMQKYSKGIYLMCYGHKPTKGSHCPKYRLGDRSENELCPHSSLCYQNRAKAKTKVFLTLLAL